MQYNIAPYGVVTTLESVGTEAGGYENPLKDLNSAFEKSVIAAQSVQIGEAVKGYLEEEFKSDMDSVSNRISTAVEKTSEALNYYQAGDQQMMQESVNALDSRVPNVFPGGAMKLLGF